MDFGMGSPIVGASGAQAQAHTGPNLEEIQTEALGFHSLAGEAKVRLLKSPWPTESLPPPTSSLLSIASQKGLLAAAGPDSVIIATTEAVRSAFNSDTSGGDIKPFSPQLTLEIGTRISQVAFSADGTLLALSAENGGGLAVYETQALLQGNTKSSFELSTNGSSVRALVPNPAPDFAELFAVVTVKGELMIANMKTRQFSNGPTGQVMKGGVSCVSWSAKGKQLVAGLGDGSAYQLAPDGVGKAEIPRPPNLEGDQHVSAISWLENKVFLVAHTPTSFDAGMAPSTTYHLITHQSQGNAYVFQLLPEICAPFGLNRSPPVQFMQRLRDFKPNIQDIIIVASTSAEDVGLFTRSSAPLTSDVPADRIASQFTTTTMANDSRRAQLPMTEDLSNNTSVIGMSLDLSSTSKVSRPIPGDEMDESQGPLPAVLILNNEGVLSGWWIVHTESVRGGTTYPGLAVVAGNQQTPSSSQPQSQTAPSPFAAAAPSGQSLFGKSSFGTSTPVGKSPFGQPSFVSSRAFGSSSSTAPAFGSQASIAPRQSPWGASSGAQTGGAAFGQPSFGSTTPFGQASKAPAFGSTGGLGSTQSPWSKQSSTPAASGSVFGQTSGLNAAKPFGLGSSTTSSAFGALSNTPSGTGSGFASFAGGGGFAAAAATAPKSGGDNIFKQTTPATSFNSNMEVGSSFGTTPQKDQTTGGLFGAGGGNFKLDSAWTNPGAPKQKQDGPTQDSKEPGFGFTSDFQKTLGETPLDRPLETNSHVFGSAQVAKQAPPAPVTNEADMASDGEEETRPKSQDKLTMAEATAPDQAHVSAKPFGTPSATGGLFGVAVQENSPATPAQGSSGMSNRENQALSSAGGPVPPIILKEEPNQSHESSKINESIPDAPLPPDPTSKASYTPGTSTNSSAANSKVSNDEAPLPPDFLRPSTKQKSPFDSDDAPLPPDFTKSTVKSKTGGSTTVDDPLPPDFLTAKSKAPTDKIDANTVNDKRSQSKEGEEALPEDDEEDLDEEGSGVDVAEEMSPSTDQSLKITPESSFGQKFDKISGQSSFMSQSSKIQPARPLFGEVGQSSVPFFPPSSKLQQSPRSPSPIRAALGAGILKPDNARSVSAPGVPLRAQSTRKVTLGRPTTNNAVYPPQISAEQRQREERERLARQAAQAQAEEEQDLSDEEDEKVRAELSTDIEPTLDLEPFVAHQDYVGNITKTGIPGTIEKVYRDINSMVDTLGLNSRSLEGFVKGHSELYSETGRDREDLETDEGWCLEEVDYLTTLESALEDDLDEGRLEDVKGKINSSRELMRELAKLKTKQTDIRQVIDAKTDPELLEALRTAPLSAEQSMTRNDLRKGYAEFQKQLAEAEEAISVLRAKLATQAKSKTKSKGGGAKVPTVEAVEKTILKMTSMVEKKSGDIDFLETQLRKLNVSSSAPISRENSPFMTPPTSARKGKPATQNTPGSNASAYGFYTPRSARSMRTSLMGSRSGAAAAASALSSPSKRIGEISQDEAARYAARASRRAQIHGVLREALTSGDVRLRALDDL